MEDKGARLGWAGLVYSPFGLIWGGEDGLRMLSKHRECSTKHAMGWKDVPNANKGGKGSKLKFGVLDESLSAKENDGCYVQFHRRHGLEAGLVINL